MLVYLTLAWSVHSYKTGAAWGETNILLVIICALNKVGYTFLVGL